MPHIIMQQLRNKERQMKLIQSNGQPIFGRLTQLPTEYNIDDYQNDFLKRALVRKLRYKKFSFIAINLAEWSIGFAVADLAWAGHGFFYCYHRPSGQCMDLHGLQPFVRRTLVQETSTQQHNYFHHRQVSIETQQIDNERHVCVKQGQKLLLKAKVKTDFGQPLYLCSPNGVRGWTFTHKSMALPVEGELHWQGQTITFDENTGALASIDDSFGFFRPETEWFWVSCQTVVNGQKVALNLASGVNESLGNENSIWINGQIFAADDVIFTQIDADTWQIRSLDQKIQLQVKTSWRRYENVNIGIIASQFSQWVAQISGTVRVNEQLIELSEQFGLLEQHYAKW